MPWPVATALEGGRCRPWPTRGRGARPQRGAVLQAAPGPAAGGVGTCAALPEPGDTRGAWPRWGAAGRHRRPPPEASLLRARCPRARSPFYLSRRNTERWASGRCALCSSVRSDLRRTLGPGQALCRTSWCLLRGRLWWAGSWVGRASASGDDRGDSEGSRHLSQCSQNFL